MLTAKEIKALNRLTEKLNVVRKSLRGEERALFDQIMTGAAFEVDTEVAAHTLAASTVKSKLTTSEVVAHAQTAAAARNKLTASEVVAHAQTAAVAKNKLAAAEVVAHAQTAAAARNKLTAPEVVAHTLQQGNVASVTLVVARNVLKISVK